jgi:hypothetical protein
MERKIQSKEKENKERTQEMHKKGKDTKEGKKKEKNIEGNEKINEKVAVTEGTEYYVCHWSHMLLPFHTVRETLKKIVLCKEYRT